MPKLQRYYPQEDAATARAKAMSAVAFRRKLYAVPKPIPPAVPAEPVQIDYIPEWLYASLLGAPVRKRGTIATIIKAVQFHFKIDDAAFFSANASQSISRPRSVAMYLCRKYSGKPLTVIGRAFRRDHTTVLNGKDRIMGLLAAGDEQLAADLAAIEASLGLGTANE